jgi:3-oxoacyl-[acyl-carrier protein] reductase
MEFGIEDKYALITGGSHGIGLATAKALAAEGCHIAICSRNRDRLDAAAKELSSIGKHKNIISLECNVLSSKSIPPVIDHLFDNWGAVDILINNVGGGGRWGTPSIEDTPENVWTEVYEKNAMAAVRFTKQVLPLMRKKKWGRIVTVASINGKEGGGRPWFNMANAAEISLMKSLSMLPEFARDGLTFNTVVPGSIMIPGTGWEYERNKDPEAYDRLMDEKYPMGRLGSPEEVASVIAFLCSKKASFINGSTVVADGGESRSF